MRSSDFLAAHPVFTYEEFAGASGGGMPNPNTTRNRLVGLVESGRVLRVRRGLFAAVSPGVDVAAATVDPYLVTSMRPSSFTVGLTRSGADSTTSLDTAPARSSIGIRNSCRYWPRRRCATGLTWAEVSPSCPTQAVPSE